MAKSLGQERFNERRKKSSPQIRKVLDFLMTRRGERWSRCRSCHPHQN